MMNGRQAKKPEKSGRFARLRRAWGKLVGNRIFLRVIAVLAALVIWFVLMCSDSSMTRQKSFKNVALSVSGEAALISRGYIITDDLGALAPAVNMTVEVTQANYERVSAASYNPHLELTQVTGEGENTLSVVFSSQLYGPVVTCEPASVTVQVERYATRRVPVVLELAGEMPEGLYLRSYKLDPTTLIVSGPQSLVSQVARVAVRLDQATLSAERMSDKQSLAIELQNGEGEAVTSPKLSVTNQSVITSTVTAETELAPQKAVPLDVQGMVTGKPAQGYAVVGIETASGAVTIAAAQEVLDSIEYIQAEEAMDISGATEDVNGTVRLRRPSGIVNTMPSEMAVTVRIRAN